MRIQIACPSCGKQGSVRDSFAGRKVQCRECGEFFLVPAPVSLPAPPQERGVVGAWLPLPRADSPLPDAEWADRYLSLCNPDDDKPRRPLLDAGLDLTELTKLPPLSPQNYAHSDKTGPMVQLPEARQQ